MESRDSWRRYRTRRIRHRVDSWTRRRSPCDPARDRRQRPVCAAHTHSHDRRNSRRHAGMRVVLNNNFREYFCCGWMPCYSNHRNLLEAPAGCGKSPLLHVWDSGVHQTTNIFLPFFMCPSMAPFFSFCLSRTMNLLLVLVFVTNSDTNA